MRSTVFLLIFAVCLVSRECAADTKSKSSEHSTENALSDSPQVTDNTAEQGLSSDLMPAETLVSSETLETPTTVDGTESGENANTKAALYAPQPEPETSSPGQPQQPPPQQKQQQENQEQPQVKQNNSNQSTEDTKEEPGETLHNKLDAEQTSETENASKPKIPSISAPKTDETTGHQDSHVNQESFRAESLSISQDTKKDTQTPQSAQTQKNKNGVTNDNRIIRQTTPLISIKDKPVTQNTNKTLNASAIPTEEEPITITNEKTNNRPANLEGNAETTSENTHAPKQNSKTKSPATGPNAPTSTNATVGVEETTTHQTSLTSTYTPAAEEFTKLKIPSQNISNSLQSLDKTDSSIGTSLLFFVAALTTLVVTSAVTTL